MFQMKMEVQFVNVNLILNLPQVNFFDWIFRLITYIFKFKASKNVVKSKNVCELIPDSGPCRAVKQRYYFSMKTKRCVTFSYGGCLGNGNNFQTLEECQGTCAKSTKSLKGKYNIKNKLL